MVGIDTDAQAQYLSLALFAQKLVDVLMAFVERGEEKDLDSYLKEAIESLKGATTEGHALEPGLRAFGNYEQVRTLDETLSTSPPKDPAELIGMLEQLLSRQGTREELREKATRAMEFFYALENQALRNMDLPIEPLPRGIRELCKTP